MFCGQFSFVYLVHLKLAHSKRVSMMVITLDFKQSTAECAVLVLTNASKGLWCCHD